MSEPNPAAAPPAAAPSPGDRVRAALLALRPHLPALLFFAAVAALLLHPALLRLGRVVPGAPTSDTYDHLWGYWWFFEELASGRLPVRTEVSHWPSGGLLWFVDPLGATISLPFQALLGPAAGYTIALLVQVWGGMAAGYALAWREVRERAPAVLAGTIYGASPYVLSLLYSGTVEYLALAPLPLAWMALRRALGEGGRGPAVAAAGAWAWATLGNFYYGAFVGILAGIAVLCERRHGWILVLERFAAVVLSWLALSAPFLAVAGWTLTSPEAVVESASAPGWNYRTLPATDLLTFLHPGDYYFPDGRLTGNHGIVHVNYVGWVVVALALWGAWKAPRVRLPLLVTAVVALGPTLCVGQELVMVGRRPVPLPAALLYFPGSPFGMVHHPFRLVVLVSMFLGLAAAHAAVGRRWLAGGAVAAVLAETLFVSPAPFPIPTADATAPPIYAALRDDPTVDALWDFPPNHHVANRRYEGLQTVHGKKIPYGVNAFLPKAFQANHFARAMMHCLKKPAVATIAREGGRPLEAWLQRPNLAKIDEGRAALAKHGFDVVVLHTDQLSASEAACARKLLGDAPERAEGDVEVWRLPSK